MRLAGIGLALGGGTEASMKNVLIIVDKSESSLWLAYYAMGLTSRIAVNVSLLMVVDEEIDDGPDESEEWIGSPEKRLESILAEGRSDNMRLDFYVVHGRMEEEIPKFILQNNISRLFIGAPQSGSHPSYAKLMKIIDRVNTTTRCEVEVVQKVSARGRRK